MGVRITQKVRRHFLDDTACTYLCTRSAVTAHARPAGGREWVCSGHSWNVRKSPLQIANLC